MNKEDYQEFPFRMVFALRFQQHQQASQEPQQSVRGIQQH